MRGLTALGTLLPELLESVRLRGRDQVLAREILEPSGAAEATGGR